MDKVNFLLVYSKFSFSLITDSLIVMSLGEVQFELNLLGHLWVSCSWMSIVLSRFGEFSAVISLNNLSVSFSSSTPSETQNVSITALRLSSFLLFFFLLHHDLMIWNGMTLSSQILSSDRSILLLMLYRVFFISFNVVFSCRIYINNIFLFFLNF